MILAVFTNVRSPTSQLTSETCFLELFLTASKVLQPVKLSSPNTPSTSFATSLLWLVENIWRDKLIYKIAWKSTTLWPKPYDVYDRYAHPGDWLLLMMSFFFFFRWGVWFVWWQNGFTDHTVWRRNKAGFLLGRYQWSFTVLTVKKQITETKSRRLNTRKKQKTSFSGLSPIVQERERDRQLRGTLIGFSRCGICLIWISGFGIF